MQDVSAAIDETMGEPVTITPVIRKPNFSPIPHDARRAAAVAVFTWKSKSSFQEQTGKRANAGQSSFTPLMEIESREPVFNFTTAALPFPILHGYRIGRCDGTTFEVTKVELDGVARTVVHVMQLGRPPGIG